jgi:hypothetical protein
MGKVHHHETSGATWSSCTLGTLFQDWSAHMQTNWHSTKSSNRIAIIFQP